VADEYHIIVTDEGDYGFTLESPQLPGFAFSRPTMSEFQRDYRDALSFAGVQGRVLGHRQQRFRSPEGREYLIRYAEDGDREARLEVVARLRAVLATDQRFELLDDAETRTGEVVFVAALPVDAIESVANQLDERGDRIVVAAAVVENGVWTTQMGAGSPPDPSWKTLAERGLSFDLTVGDLMKVLSVGEARQERLLVSV
jgi:hypothetical protein